MQNDYTSGEKRIGSIGDLLNCTYAVGIYGNKNISIFFRKIKADSPKLYILELKDYKLLKKNYENQAHNNKNVRNVSIERLIENVDRQILITLNYQDRYND